MPQSTDPLDAATRHFADAHATADVRRLALQARPAGVDLAAALCQIAGRQAARHKLPRWATCDGVAFPPHLAIEQCSSQATAAYKASLLSQSTGTLVDLTGGMGVDCEAMASRFVRVTYVERQEQLCRYARHNFAALGHNNIDVVKADAEQFVRTMPAADVIYLDPARRDGAGRRTYGIADCSPDVAALAPLLLDRAPLVMAKLSPMLDVSHTLAALPAVSDVHIVSAGGECRELLVVMRRGHAAPPIVHCVSDDGDFTYAWGSVAPAASQWNGQWREGLCLYEPNPSLMKAGCHDLLAGRYGLQVVSRDSHLLLGERIDRFPGRAFTIEDVSTLNKADLRRVLTGIDRACVAVRNFPLAAEALRRRLRLADGGDTYIFGTTTAARRHIVLLCRKAQL